MTDPELWHLRVLVAVVDTGTFTAAARRLAVSQPAVSRAVAVLERCVGGAVVDRSTHHCEATPAGRLLADRARPLLEEADAAMRAARSLTGAGRRRVVLALKSESGGRLVPDILARSRSLDPELEVDLLFLAPYELVGAVRDGRAAASLVVGHAELGDDVETEVLDVEPRVAILPVGHPSASRVGLRRADLRDASIVRWPGVPADLDRYYQGRDPAPGAPRTPSTGPPAGTLADALRLVELGRGVTFLPESVAARHGALPVARCPVDGVSPSISRLVWRVGSRDAGVAVLVRAATEAADAA